MRRLRVQTLVLAMTALLGVGAANAFQFEMGPVKASLDSTLTVGFGMRLGDQDENLIGDPSEGATAAGIRRWSNGDNGNLNYDQGDFFSAYVKGTHDLLLTFPGRVKFMARGTWLRDFAAAQTDRTDLSEPAERQVARDARLLDLWVSKEFDIAGRASRVRVGNQVVNWGESLFTPGGINATNGLDIQRLLVPGTQLKEAVIPAPLASVASALGGGFNVEAYYQFRWNQSRLPPSGSYFSAADFVGKGKDLLFIDTVNPNFGGVDAGFIAGALGISVAEAQARAAAGEFVDPTANPPQLAGFGTIGIPFLSDKEPRQGGQYGVALHYKPRGLSLDLGLYFLNYHDKFPNAETRNGQPRLRFLEDRKLYGVSANFPVGNVAVGWEFSYRPKDAVALTTSCFNPGGPLDFATNAAPTADCEAWIDREKYQMALTGIWLVTPGDYGALLRLLGADTATLLAEVVGIRYPGVRPDKRYVRTINGVPVMQAPSANLNFWEDQDPNLGLITGSEGTEYSAGYIVDFSWIYDGKLIPGWQVQPGFTFSHAAIGDTPTAGPTFLKGNMSTNLYVLFNKNPARWQAGINYAAFYGNSFRQPLRDRDFLGGFVAYNF